MRRFLTLLFALFFVLGKVYAQPSLALYKFLNDTTLRWASVGVDVRLVESGEQILEHNSQIALIPASVTKLISTAFAMDICGAECQLETNVYLSNGSLIVNAVGDPTLDSKYFPENNFLKRLVSDLQMRGVKEVDNITFKPMIPSQGRYNGAWLSEDVANYYGANSLPFTWSDNSTKITLRSDSKSGYFLAETPCARNCEYNCMVVAEPNAKADVWVYGGADGYREIRGVMPQWVKEYSVNGSMGFPEEYFKAELGRFIKIGGSEKAVESKDNPILITSYTSPTFSEIINIANKYSVNLYVEALANIAANRIEGSGTYCDKISEWLAEVTPYYKGVVLKDACGLAPLNRVPVSVFTDLLLWSRISLPAVFENSLAVSGGAGTIKNFTRNYPHMHGKIVAKSGSMSGVRALSGFMKARSGKQYAFTIIANGFTAKGSDVMNLFAAFLNDLYVEL